MRTGTTSRVPTYPMIPHMSFEPYRLESAPLKRFAIVFLVLVVSCGKRGDPRPPIPLIPKATSDLVVTQRANKLILSWSYPALTTAGKTLTTIRRVSVFRYSEEIPATPTVPATVSTPEPAVAHSVSQLPAAPPLTAAQFGKLSHRVDSIEGANLPASTAGAKLVYEDS